MVKRCFRSCDEHDSSGIQTAKGKPGGEVIAFAGKVAPHRDAIHETGRLEDCLIWNRRVCKVLILKSMNTFYAGMACVNNQYVPGL